MSGGQTADAQLYLDNNTWRDPEYADDDASMSSGSFVPDLGDVWRYGCPRSLDWDSDIDVRSDDEEVSEYVMVNLRHVLEGSLWESVRAFLVLDDVLCMRTTAGKWNVAGLYGPCAEPNFFLNEVRTCALCRQTDHEIRLQSTVRI